MAAPEHATWYDDVSMTSPGGSALLTSAVGPADVSVDKVDIDWSTESVGSAGQWSHRSVSQKRLTGRARV